MACHWCFFPFTTPSALTGPISQSLGGHCMLSCWCLVSGYFYLHPYLGGGWWWFQMFSIFTPIWGRLPFWHLFFRWVETTNQLYIAQKNAGIWNLFKYQYHGGPPHRGEPKFSFSSGSSPFVKDHRNHLQSLVPLCCIQRLIQKTSQKLEHPICYYMIYVFYIFFIAFLWDFTWNPYFRRSSFCWFWQPVLPGFWRSWRAAPIQVSWTKAVAPRSEPQWGERWRCDGEILLG